MATLGKVTACKGCGVEWCWIPMRYGRQRVYCDRFGYVPGNVRIVSARFNRLKSDHDLGSIAVVSRYIRKASGVNPDIGTEWW